MKNYKVFSIVTVILFLVLVLAITFMIFIFQKRKKVFHLKQSGVSNSNMQKFDSQDILQNIQNKKTFAFLKFGDGEYFAIIKKNGTNCDGTKYTIELGQKLKEALQFFSSLQDVYIGQWESDKDIFKKFDKMVEPNKIQWADFHSMIFKTIDQYFNKRFCYHAIKNTDQQKIYVCNKDMVENLQKMLNIDDFVIVDPSNWFSKNYKEVLESVLQKIKNPRECILLTSAGMGSKVLYMDVKKHFPSVSCIDIGSALDLICSDKRSRDYHSLTEKEIQMIRDDLLY